MKSFIQSHTCQLIVYNEIICSIITNFVILSVKHLNIMHYTMSQPVEQGFVKLEFESVLVQFETSLVLIPIANIILRA